MSHVDEDLLAGHQLGEPLSEGNLAHAAACAECTAKLEQFRALVSDLDSVGGPIAMEAPPSRVWDSISSELQLDTSAKATVVALPSRTARPKPRASWMLVAASAAGVALGVTGAAVANLVWAQSGAAVVAATPLENLSTLDVVGEARVEERADGSLFLIIDAPYEPVDGAAYEVWLIDQSITGMISVGYLESAHGEFAIPAGFDLPEHPIVDISVEPHDGVPTHSGVSVTRGVLDL